MGLRRISAYICGVLFLAAAGCAAREPVTPDRFVPGIYEGSGMGMHDDIVIRMQCDRQSILKIEVVEHKETPMISDAAFETIPPAILKAQSAGGVDAVTGATETSKGIISAVDEAINKASVK